MDNATIDASEINPHVFGEVEERHRSLVHAFADQLDDRAAGGASFALYQNGRRVARLSAGTADPSVGRPWITETTQVLFSVSKGLATILLARLHERGDLDLLKPIRHLWPEFATHGKGDLCIADVLAHRAGVSAPRDDLTLEEALDSCGLAARLAAQEPLWQPGTAHAYHAATFGVIAEELVRRAVGTELADVFESEIARPLDADVTFRPRTSVTDRLAPLTFGSTWPAPPAGEMPTDMAWIERAMTLGGAFPELIGPGRGMNDPRVIAAGMAGIGAVGTADGVARIWSAVVTETHGVRLLEDETVQLLSHVRSSGAWRFPMPGPFHAWGAGVQVCSERTPWLSSASLGHDGVGGQTGMADPVYRVGLGYLRNSLGVDDPLVSVIAALVHGTDASRRGER